MIKGKKIRRVKLKDCLLGLCLFSGITQLYAQEQLKLTLDKAIEIALSENPTIKVADKDIELKKVADQEAWQNLLPEASITGTSTYTIKAAQLKLGSNTFKMGQDGANTAAAALTVSLPIFAPAVYKTMKLTKVDIELAKEKARSSRLDMINQVTKAYYSLMLSQDSYDVLKKSYKQSEDNFNVVNAKYKQGTVSEYDKISAEVQMRSIKPNMISASNAVILAKIQLKVLMGITANVDLVVDDNLSNYETAIYANQIQESPDNLANNSTIKQFNLNVSLLQHNLSLAKTNFMPTASLAYTYQYQSLYNNNLNFFKYDWTPSSNIALSVVIPLYKASNFTKLKTAKLNIAEMKLNRTNTERQLNMQVTSYKNNMSASLEQVSSNKESVAMAEKALMISSKRYDVGKGTVLEMNSSQVALTQAELTYNQSIYDYLSAKSDLDYVLGNEDFRIKPLNEVK